MCVFPGWLRRRLTRRSRSICSERIPHRLSAPMRRRISTVRSVDLQFLAMYHRPTMKYADANLHAYTFSSRTGAKEKASRETRARSGAETRTRSRWRTEPIGEGANCTTPGAATTTRSSGQHRDAERWTQEIAPQVPGLPDVWGKGYYYWHGELKSWFCGTWQIKSSFVT